MPQGNRSAWPLWKANARGHSVRRPRGVHGCGFPWLAAPPFPTTAGAPRPVGHFGVRHGARRGVGSLRQRGCPRRPRHEFLGGSVSHHVDTEGRSTDPSYSCSESWWPGYHQPRPVSRTTSRHTRRRGTTKSRGYRRSSARAGGGDATRLHRCKQGRAGRSGSPDRMHPPAGVPLPARECPTRWNPDHGSPQRPFGSPRRTRPGQVT